MGKEINGNAALTLSDMTGIGEAVDSIRSLLDDAGLTYQETANPESCEKPHMIVSVPDSQTGKVTAICCLLVSARTENGDADSINIAKILNRQRDSDIKNGLLSNCSASIRTIPRTIFRSISNVLSGFQRLSAVQKQLLLLTPL